MKHQVILLYVREDAEIGHRVRDDMRAARLTVWTDEAFELGSEEWLNAVEKAAVDAGCIVLITSSQVGTSDRIKKALDDLSTRVKVPIFHKFAWGDKDLYWRREKSDDEPIRLSDAFYGRQIDYDEAIQSLIAEIGRNTLQAGPPPSDSGFEESPPDLGGIPKKEEKPEPLPSPAEAPVTRDIDSEKSPTGASKPPPPPAPSMPGAPPAQPAPAEPMYPQPAPVARAPIGGLPRPSLPSLPSRSQPAPAEPVEFTGFWPKAVQPQKSYALMVFAHVKWAASEVRDVAAGFSEMMGGTQTSGSAPSQVQIITHTMLTFVPQVEGLTFQPAEQSLIWEPGKRFQSVTFLFNVPSSEQTNFTGRILIFEGPLVIGEIPVTMQVTSSVTTASMEETPLNRIEPIFASYSHRDTPVIEYFRKTRSHLGQKMLVDIYDLRAGEHWADRLLEMIDESALFQLFWSEHSAQSEYVKQEWQHALKHLETRPRFIQPVWWDMPMHPPPPELAHLHFQRIGLPPVTRLQVALRKVRGWLGR
jgi:hypothetical protein